MRRNDDVYLEELVRASREPLAPPVAPSLQLARPVKRFTLIGDFLWEAQDLVPELERFIEVQTLDLHPALQSASPDQDAALTTLEAVRKFLQSPDLAEPDIVMLYAQTYLLSEELFSIIRAKWSCPILGMNLDEKVTFLPEEIFRGHNGGYARWARHFDINLTNALAVTDWYRARQLPIIYMPQGFKRPATPPPAGTPEYKYQLSFMGAWKMDRGRIVGELQGAGIPIQLFGRGWPGGGWVDDPATVFRDSQMNLGIGYATPRLTNVKGRDFECPGAGGCYLTTYNWELAPYFENGKEILMYREVPELIEIFSYYRRRPEICAQIARAAYARSIREHTWEQRFRSLFQELGILRT